MAPPAHNVSIDLLGRFGVTIDGRAVPAAGWGRRQAAALVKVLALTPRHVMHREQLIDLLWPDLTMDEAGPRLHKASYFARRACDADGAVALRNDLVVLFEGCDVAVDALEFEAAVTAALGTQDRAAAAAAADRYVGDLLPEDLYVDWADGARERLRLLHLDVLRLGERWEVLVAADPTDEEAHIRVARRFVEQGDVRAALRQLERCEQSLRDQLDVELGAEAVALRAELLDLVNEPARAPSRRPHSADAAPSAPVDGAGRQPDAIQSVLSAAWAGELVGRDRELKQIATAWERTRAGLPSFVMIGGEPGIGKTTLAAHATVACRADGARVFFGRSDVGVDISYQPFSEAIRHWARTGTSSHDPRQIAALLSRLEPIVHGAAEHPGEQAGGLEHRRYELLEALRDWSELLVSDGPAVVMLDDLHWADDASVFVLRNLIRHPPSGSLLVLCTYRPEELVAGHPLRDLLADVRSDAAVFRIDLHGLDADAVQSMVASSAGAPLETEGLAFGRMLHEHTGGNPLFVSVTLRHPEDSGIIEPDVGRWMLDESLQGLSVAAGVSEVVERRMARLDEATVDCVRIAAVLGESFDLGTLAEVVSVEERRLIDMLFAAAQAGLLAEEPDEIDRYRFTHALIRDALEASVPRSRQLRVHWAAGTTLELRRPEEQHLDEIAHHLVLGAPVGDRRHAASACIRAGDAGLRHAAFERARDHFGQALELLADDADPDLEWQALNGRGEARGALLEPGDTLLRDHRRAATIAREHRWRVRLARSALGVGYFQLPGSSDRSSLELLDEALRGLPEGADATRCELLAAHSIQCVAMGDPQTARTSAEEALLIARREDDPSLIGVALSARCYTLLGSPAAEELRRTAREAVGRPLPPEGRFIPPHYALGVVAMQRGDREELDRAMEEVRQAAERRHSASLAIFLPSWEGAVALAAGEFEASERSARAARDMSHAPAWQHAYAGHVVARRIEMGRESELTSSLVPYVGEVRHAVAQRCILANIQHRSGAHDLAAETLSGLAERSWTLDGWDRAVSFRHLGELAVALRDVDLAEALLEQITAYSGQLLTSFTGVTLEAAADRVRGQALLTLGRLDDAIAACDDARRLEDVFGARALAVRTAYWQARARRAVGDRAAEADELAARAFETAQNLGMTALVEDLRQLRSGG